jgi:asparagine synthase (glutamine-hydrolysing)
MNNTAQGAAPREELCAHGGEWFLALPDNVASCEIVAALPPTDCRVDHPSGRPWLIGRWDVRDMRVVSAGRIRVAVLGACAAEASALERTAAGIRDVTDLAPAFARIPGSFHLLASVDGTACLQGTLSGVRRVFCATIAGVTVAADRADVLATLTGARLDEGLLAARLLLLGDTLPSITMDNSLWQGVAAIASDSYLRVAPSGHGSVGTRWTPPDADLSLEEGALALRQALDAAVTARRSSGRVLGSDLSGGLDSTSLCYLAAAGGRPLTTFTSDTGDPRDDDPMWADVAAEGIPHVQRLVVAASELPLHYTEITRPAGPLDEPHPDIVDQAAERAVAELLRGHGVELRLKGEGGDELLSDSESYLPGLVRRRPLLALSHLRAFRAFDRWSWRTTVRALRPADPRGSLERSARCLRAGLVDTRDLSRDDRAPVAASLPAWATPRTVELVRGRMLRAADELRVFSRDAAQDELLRGIVETGQKIRRASQFSASIGLPVSSPFLDDAVLEACLAVRPEERAHPWRYKPLLTAAMRGIVPPRSLARVSKPDGTSLVLRGIRENREKLVALCEDSRLARLGMIDAGALRAVCSTSLWASEDVPVALSDTFACERWLRDLEELRAPQGCIPPHAPRLARGPHEAQDGDVEHAHAAT